MFGLALAADPTFDDGFRVLFNKCSAFSVYCNVLSSLRGSGGADGALCVV